MLEQQQAWLVSGLQALYHQNIRGQGWSGEPLKLESNGFPLTHDLLSHLGVLNQSCEHFGVNTNNMVQGGSEPVMQGSTPHSPHTHISRHSLSPVTPDISGDMTLDIGNPFTKTLSRAPQSEEQVPDISNRWAIQDIPPWPIEDFGLFDDMDMMLAARNPDLLFDDSFLNESMDIFTNENARGVTLT